MTASSNFTTAIDEYSNAATGLMGAAKEVIPSPATFPTIPEETDDAKIKRAQGMLSSGLTQLERAAKLDSEERGRNGYADVVALMKTTATTAEAICARIRSMVGSPSTAWPTIDSTLMHDLTSALLALAQLSPAAAWAKTPPPQ
jgi:hypothetical protein